MATSDYTKAVIDAATLELTELADATESATSSLESAVKSFLFLQAVDTSVTHQIGQEDNPWGELRDALVEQTLNPQGATEEAYIKWRASVDEMVDIANLTDVIQAECQAILNGTSQQMFGLPYTYVRSEMNKAADFGGFGAGDMSTMIANRLPRLAQLPDGLDLLKGSGSTGVGAALLINVNVLNAKMIPWAAEMLTGIAKIKRTEDVADLEIIVPLLAWAYNGIVSTKQQMLGTMVQVNETIEKLSMTMQELGTILPTKLNVSKDLEIKLADISQWIGRKEQMVDGMATGANYLGQLAASALNAHNTVAHLIDETQA